MGPVLSLRWTALALGLATMPLALAPPGTAAADDLALDLRAVARCASSDHPGGDWASLNADPSNSRSQPDEHLIGTKRAAALTPAWSFSGASVGAPGGMRSTPIVAYGCVYVALGQGYLGDRGDLFALNADTGQLVWHARIDGSILGLTSKHGLVYAAVSKGTRSSSPLVTEDMIASGTSAVAFDAQSGRRQWVSTRLDDGNSDNGTFINATPVAFTAGGRNLLFVPLSGGGGDGARVPMYFLDSRNGKVVKKAYSLSEADYQLGYGGTGIWSTAAYDSTTQHLYAGTSDSDGHARQHPYNNAIIRIDANPLRSTFGSVVSAYQGTSEHGDLDAVIGYPNNPACGTTGELVQEDPSTFFDTSASTDCLELDYDFGASPNLYRDASGRLKVSALQKSGVFHAVDVERMTADWRFYVGPGGPAMDAGTSAVGANHLFVPATPNLVFSLEREGGALSWVSTMEMSLFPYGPVTHANGVLYSVNDVGFLIAIDASTGLVLSRSLISASGQAGQCFGIGSGVAVARNTVYAPCNGGAWSDLAQLPSDPGGIVAYR